MAVEGTADGTLRPVFSRLVEELQANDVIDDLYQSYILEKEEYESIQDACGRASSQADWKSINRRLLMAIGNRPAHTVTRVVEILRKNQKALADALERAHIDVNSPSQTSPVLPQQPAEHMDQSGGVSGVQREHVCCPASHPKLKEKPTLKDLVAHVVPVIATPKWCNVGLELGVEQFKLETIGGFSREDFESYCYAMFSSWLNGEPGTGRGEKTWAAVIAAVETVKGKDAGYREAIKEIFGGNVPLRRKPELKDLVSNCVTIAAQDTWYDVGLQLCISSDKLNSIQSPQTCNGCCKKMFQCWLNGEQHTGYKTRSWETVLQAVSKVFGDGKENQIQQSLGLHLSCVPVPGGSMAAGCSSSHVCTPSLHFTSAPPPPPSGVAAAVSLSSNGQVTDILTHPAEIIRALGQQVDAKWKHFGVQLSVEPTLLDAVNKDNFGNTGDCMLDLVSKWVGRLEGTGNLPRTWQTVVEAVNNAGFEQLAKYLAKKYGVILPEE